MSIKKAVAVAGAVLAIGSFSAVSAQIQMSGGVYAGYSGDFGGGPTGMSADVSVMGQSFSVEQTLPTTGVTFGGFLDLTYAEIGVGTTIASGKEKIESNNPAIGGQEGSDAMLVMLDFSLMGKFPIDLGSMVIFPTAGINYAHCVVSNAESVGGESFSDHGNFSKLWVKFGLGADFPIGESMFFRTSLLYGIGFDNKVQSDVIDMLKAQLGALGASVDAKTIGSHGLDLRLGLGFNF